MRELNINAVDEKEISKDKMEEMMDAKYKITTIIPTIDDPREKTYILDVEEFTELLSNYNLYAEFIVSVEKLN